MIIKREAQEALLEQYLKKHSIERTEGFADGMTAMIDFIDKLMRAKKDK